MNQVVLVGRIANDPTFDTHNRNGEERPFVRFRLAVSRRFARDSAQKADFFNVSYWGRGAAAIVEYLHKGREVAVSGEIRIDERRADNGSYDHFVYVNADEVKLLGSGRRDSVTDAAADDELSANVVEPMAVGSAPF